MNQHIQAFQAQPDGRGAIGRHGHRSCVDPVSEDRRVGAEHHHQLSRPGRRRPPRDHHSRLRLPRGDLSRGVGSRRNDLHRRPGSPGRRNPRRPRAGADDGAVPPAASRRRAHAPEQGRGSGTHGGQAGGRAGDHPQRPHPAVRQRRLEGRDRLQGGGGVLARSFTDAFISVSLLFLLGLLFLLLPFCACFVSSF